MKMIMLRENSDSKPDTFRETKPLAAAMSRGFELLEKAICGLNKPKTTFAQMMQSKDC